MRVHCICFSLDGDIVSNLRAVDIAVIPNSQCQYYMNSGDIFSSTMCAGYTHGGKDTCQVLYPLHGFRPHFGSFNPTHPLHPSKKKKKKKKKKKIRTFRVRSMCAERCIYHQSKMLFIYGFLMYLWSKGQEVSIFGQYTKQM